MVYPLNIRAGRLRSAFLLALLCCILLSACSHSLVRQRAALDAVLDDGRFAGARWGAAVKSVDTGKVLYQRDDAKAFIPASNMKLFTTAAALLKLGPDFRYTTRLYANGDMIDGVLYGDLFIRGSGDPTLSADAFESWANELEDRGITEVRGCIIGDDRFFDDIHLGADWSWEDETYGYAAQISGLSFNENRVIVEILPGENIGDPAIIKIAPNTKYVSVLNGTVTAASEEAGNSLHFFRERGSNRIRVDGTICLRSPPLHTRLSVDNPARFAATVFREALQSRGILVSGAPASAGDYETQADYSWMKEIGVHVSPPLSEIIKDTNRSSNNLYAEQLFRTLGSLFGGEGSAEHSAEVIKEVLLPMGISPEGLAVYDGSGLSRLNLVTPSQIVALLEYMAKHEYFPIYYDSLAVAGKEGTLRRRMKDGPAANNIHAKTGSFRQTTTLSGYATTKAGELVAFSLMSNNYLGPSADARALEDRFCEILAGQPN